MGVLVAPFRVALTALFFSFAVGIAHADEATPHDLLARMASAMKTLDYQGSFVYQHNGRVDALRIFHAGGGTERERLVSLTGNRSEVVRNGDTVVCLQQGGEPTVFSTGRRARLVPLVPDTAADALADHYTLSLVDGTDRVAGYATRVVEILPRDRFRYGYRLWLDESNQLLLRSVVLDADGRALEQFMFVALEVGARPSDADLMPSRATGPAAAGNTDEVPIRGRPQWNATALPPGFSLSVGQRPAGVASVSQHLVYSDGIASVSVYVEPRGNEPIGPDAAINRGALNVYTRGAGEVRITVLGDVPSLTVERIARSVERTVADAR